MGIFELPVMMNRLGVYVERELGREKVDISASRASGKRWWLGGAAAGNACR